MLFIIYLLKTSINHQVGVFKHLKKQLFHNYN